MKMEKSIYYLDRAKEKLNVSSDYEMAAKLGVTRAAISKWRRNKGVMDDFAAAKIAEILDADAMAVIAAANAERESDVERQEFWKNFYKRLGGIAASIFFAVNLIMTPTPSQAAPILKAEVPHCILC
jgi:transcriptional regulator with XRE-family HTH domain